MSVKEKIKTEIEYVLHGVTTMDALTVNIGDKFVPAQQKVIRLEKLKSKCADIRQKFIDLFAPLSQRENKVRDEVKNIRKGFEAIFNHAQSAIDMLENGDFSKDEQKHFIDKQEYRFQKLTTLISGMYEAHSAKLEKAIYKASGLNVSDSDPVQEASENVPANKEGSGMKIIASKEFPEIEKVLRNFGPHLKRNEKHRQRLPTAAKDATAFRKMPVIPVFTGQAPTAEDLSLAGFDVDKLDNRYVIINDQIVVGVKQTLLEDADLPTPKRKKDGNPADDFLVAVEAAIEDFTKWKITRIEGSEKSAGYIWYWYVRTSMLDNLMRRGKHMNVKDWKFAFLRVSSEEIDRIYALPDKNERDKKLRALGLEVPVEEVKENDRVETFED